MTLIELIFDLLKSSGLLVLIYGTKKTKNILKKKIIENSMKQKLNEFDRVSFIRNRMLIHGDYMDQLILRMLK